MSETSQNPIVDGRYSQWKSRIPVLYDWFTNHCSSWPSLCCRWGERAPEEQEKQKISQRLYFSEQTDGSVPNALVIATVQVVNPRVAAAEHISKFEEDARSPYIRKHKTILHPGEVNRIKELPQNCNIVATLTDSPKVFVWNVKTQLNRQSVVGSKSSCADLELVGHEDNAEYALAMCRTEPLVLSGGKDKSVVLWSISDHISSLASDGHKVGARAVFKGHKDTVEDVQFNPSSAQEFCSVGDDYCLLLWDARMESSPAIKVERAHSADVHCIDWNTHDVNLILTGSADNTIHMYDRRKLTHKGVGSPIHIFKGHTAPVLCVQWSPHKKSVFGSGAEDCILNIWDLKKIGGLGSCAGKGNSRFPPGLFFRHAGHRDKVVDFHWNPISSWTIASVSADTQKTGGGILQIWRMTDLLSGDEDVVLAELEKRKAHIPACPASSSRKH